MAEDFGYKSSQKVKSSAASKALESHFTVLTNAIDPLILCNDLSTREVLDSSTLDEIITDSTKSKQDKASETLKAVTQKLGSDPDVFIRFSDVLLNEPATKEYVEPLKKSYEDCLVEELYKTSTPVQFVKVCKKESLFEGGARLVVKSRNSELWQAVLSDKDEQCRHLFIEKILHPAISETQDPDAVSVAVKSFMMADLPNDLIKLLEVVLFSETSTFKENLNLQNLLILTAIKCDQSHVMDYIGRLDNYSGPDIANICISYGLFEEAFTILQKFDNHIAAMEVLVQHMRNLGRASEYAEKCNKPAVWGVLAKAQLDAQQLKDSIDSYIKSGDISMYKNVVETAKAAGNFDDLIRYLWMARELKKESFIDTELAFALAKTGRVSEVKEFLAGGNQVDIEMLRERCAEEKLDTVSMLLKSRSD